MHRIYKVGEAGVYKSFLVEYIFIVSMWTSSIHKWEYKMVKGQTKDFFRNTYLHTCFNIIKTFIRVCCSCYHGVATSNQGVIAYNSLILMFMITLL